VILATKLLMKMVKLLESIKNMFHIPGRKYVKHILISFMALLIVLTQKLKPRLKRAIRIKKLMLVIVRLHVKPRMQRLKALKVRLVQTKLLLLLLKYLRAAERHYLILLLLY